MALRRYIVYLSIALAIVTGSAAALPAVASTGRAVLAALFMGATGVAARAHTAPLKSTAPPKFAPEAAPESLPAPGQEAAEKKVDQNEADKRTAPKKKTAQETAAKESAAVKEYGRIYSVKVDDSLSKIAAEQNVSGGWKELYADNLEVVGGDPSLIRPGTKLRIGGEKAGKTLPKSSAVTSTSRPEPSSKTSATKMATKAAPKSSSVAPPSRSESSSNATTRAKTANTVNGLTAPASGVSLGTGYKTGGSLWSSGQHTGVDFLAASGTPVKAVGAGTVVSAGWGGAYGNQIIIQLIDGHYAQYAHLSSILVSSGQTVTAGRQIGLSGATGNVTGPHLHFEIRTTPDYGSDIDPVAYLRSKGVSIG